MSEFGHSGSIISGCCIDSWGAGPFVIEVEGKEYRFEDSDRFGPFVLNRDYSVKVNQPGPRSPFWKAHDAWRKRGRRLEDDGVRCVWEPLKAWKIRVIKRGRHRFVETVEKGDPDCMDEEIVEVIEE